MSDTFSSFHPISLEEKSKLQEKPQPVGKTSERKFFSHHCILCSSETEELNGSPTCDEVIINELSTCGLMRRLRSASFLLFFVHHDLLAFSFGSCHSKIPRFVIAHCLFFAFAFSSLVACRDDRFFLACNQQQSKKHVPSLRGLWQRSNKHDSKGDLRAEPQSQHSADDSSSSSTTSSAHSSPSHAAPVAQRLPNQEPSPSTSNAAIESAAADAARRSELDARRKQQDEERERRAREREERQREQARQPEVPRLPGEKRFINYFFINGAIPDDSLELVNPRQEGECGKRRET
jgi:hypothetical protein